MAKLRSIDGKMSGKLGGRVYAVRNGEQIIRERPISIFNPNTQAQVNARARLKMLSQLSAVVGGVLPLSRIGSVSPRNRFVKINYQASTAVDGSATIPLNELKLTQSVVGLPIVSAVTASGNTTISLQTTPSPDVDRVVYVILQVGDDNEVRLRTSVVVERTSENDTFSASPAIGGTGLVVLAYGIIDRSENARVVYGDLQALTAELIATLVANRTLTEADVTLTETRGTIATQGV